MSGLSDLKHLVILMMENRSFDHMLGFLKSPTYPINGLNGNETNPDTANTQVQVSNDAIFFGDLTPDPGHSHFDVMQQMFDKADPTTTAIPPMSGFVRDYQLQTNDLGKSHNIMKCFSSGKLSSLSTLARQFCVCDNWFSSVPGPTFPNRAFAHAATSIGHVDMSPVGYVGISKTIYELLDDNGIDSCIYYSDTTLALTFPKLLLRMNQYFAQFQRFIDDCRNNSLPAYSFIEPRYNTLELEELFFSASDQHPDHDVHEGENLIEQVFQAIWSNPQVRNSTLLAIIYDEHGGLYDHVSPTQRVPNPDGKNWAGADGNPDPPFDFTWLGVRVPAILVSPYIQAGSIDHSLYEHSSVITMARKLFVNNWQTAFLTQRDRQANTFEGNLSLAMPRSDTIQFPARMRAEVDAVEPAQLILKPLTEHQKGLVQMASYLEQQQLPTEKRSNIDPHTIRTEGAAAKYVNQVMLQLHAAAPPAKPRRGST